METEVYKSIEELKAIKETPDAVFEGVKAIMEWTSGRQVTEGEYDTAVTEFNNAPIDGR